MSLVDNPRISPYLDELLGNDSWRLDHIYFNVLRQAPPGEHRLGGMHGGRSRGGLSTHEYDYRNDAFVNGLSVVAYELNDVNPGDGGFGCCPGETVPPASPLHSARPTETRGCCAQGSHKSNIPFPDEWRSAHSEGNVPLPQDCTRAVPAKAGSAIIFVRPLCIRS